ncbi:MAG: pyruvate kinase [Lachnospiraceae bacterium]|nr:pyruvate kinase [Lachnospiraceae bacterium]
MKKTKIICTMGPNADNRDIMKALAENGMDVARFNFSHGSYEEQKKRMDLLKNVREEVKKPIAILLDTKGPEIRTGTLAGGKKVRLEEGQQFILTTENVEGDQAKCSQTYKDLPKDLKAGDRVLIDDGLIELTVVSLTKTDVVCRVDNGGELGERKGINLPNVQIHLPAITEKDKKDIIFGIEQDIDFIAASFVRSAAAVKEIKKLLKEHNAEHIDVIAKVENAEGIHNIDEIIRAADGVMVARGDMGVEIPAYEVPHYQKLIIEKCNALSKPAIVATQMLDSMIRNPRPTRAEVTDVSNAITESADAIMLSGETAMGKYPIETLQTMVQIAEYAESNMEYEIPDFCGLKGDANVSSAVGVAAVRTASNVQAACIVTPTMSGQTARLVCNFRPKAPIYAVTPNERAQRKMQIDWGVLPLRGYQEDSTENIISHAMYVVKREKLVQSGDMVVFTAGDPSTNLVRGKGNMTNMMHVIEAK